MVIDTNRFIPKKSPENIQNQKCQTVNHTRWSAKHLKLADNFPLFLGLPFSKPFEKTKEIKLITDWF